MRRRRVRRSLVRVVVGSVLTAYAALALGLMYVRWCPPLITMVQVQRWIESRPDAGVYRRRYAFIPLKNISENLAHAVIAAEDERFYQHHGFDWDALQDAAESNWKRGRIRRGGSTITQQLVKNLFLTTHQNLLRKVVEVPLTVLAELILPKPRILELYLNVVEWGPGVYGAEAAARYHYGLSAAGLDRERAARLAACLPAPRVRVPHKMNRLSVTILRHMSRMGW